MGVPLIVSEEIYELAEFVKENRCGVVFKIIEGKPVICDDININDFEVWKSLVENAYLVGKRFERKNVVKQYDVNWKEVLNYNIKL
jgi:hypothetical protein